MTTPPGHDKRHVYGPRPLGAVLPPVLRPAFKRRSPAAARILLDWDAIVGPGLAAVTTPRRLSAGVLAIGCSGPAALELQHQADHLAERINTYVGAKLVERIRVIQESRPAPPHPGRRAASAVVEAAATRAVADVPAGPLHDSLHRLGRRVLTGA